MAIISILTKEDLIVLDSKNKIPAGSFYENITKFYSTEGKIYYKTDDGIITDSDKVVELGFISTETFKKIKEITGSIDIPTLIKLVEDMKKYDVKIIELETDNEELKLEIERLKKALKTLDTF